MGNSNVFRMSTEDKEKLWAGWHAGLSNHKIAKLVGIKPVSVFLFLEKFGGIEPVVKTRRAQFLSSDEREEISRGIASGQSIRSIAQSMGRSPSTVSREITRNGGAKKYRAARAEKMAWVRAKRPKFCRLALHPRLRQRVVRKLKQQWSPEQISGWLLETFPDDPEMHVSHETIYKTLYIQSRGTLNKELRDHLRTKRRYRQSRTKTLKGTGMSNIVDPITISERPAEVEDRAVPGHWEGDLIAGDRTSFIVTLVERHSRFVLLARVKNKETKTVVKALTRQMKKLPVQLKKSLTWDRGSEMAAHKQFSVATDVDVYFCDPYSPWQRGSNENTNGLLRQYFPKGESVQDITQVQLNAVANKLNTRPRKTLGFKTPAYILEQALH